MEVLSYGGIVRSLKVPGRQGQSADVVLGFNHLEPYLAAHPYFGAITGRVAGRIPGGSFIVEGKTFELARNSGPNHLHGGERGLDKRIWKAEQTERTAGASVRLSYHSPDGEEGYPGAVDFAVTYTLTDHNVFIVESEALSDRATPVNLTHHSFFNLAGEGSGDIFAHELMVAARHTVAVDDEMTPLGCLEPVAGRACDLNTPRRLGNVIAGLFLNHGDLYLLGEQRSKAPVPVARLSDPASGRVLTVSTNESCLQLYTGAYLDGTLIGKSGRPYGRFAGVCLECQGYPGALNAKGFPSILLEPGVTMRRVTEYAFSVA